MSRSRGFNSVVLLAVTGCFASTALSDDTPSVGAADRQAILALLSRMEVDFNAGDAKALASCWTENGEFVGASGARAAGRDGIEKHFQEIFAGQKESPKLKFHMLHFRLASDSLALVEAIADIKPPLVVNGAPVANFVLVKQSQRWLIENARATTSNLPPDPSHLKDLSWLVGDWSTEPSANGIALRTSCDWTVNHAFLIRKFQIESKEAFMHGGTEVIGWDPRCNGIRSWIFDSDGGFGENVWVRDGNRWLIRYCGTLADGREASATHVLTNVDANNFTIQSKDRVVNGAAQSDVAEVSLKRQAEAKPAIKTEQPLQPGDLAKPKKPEAPATKTPKPDPFG
jgi:uncharacterized protein (TIGR02246 family)